MILKIFFHKLQLFANPFLEKITCGMEFPKNKKAKSI